MKHSFEADSVIIKYGNRTILSNIYIKSETGLITGLVGNNGSGKSSLLKAMFGTLNAESVSTRIDNKHLKQPYLTRGAVNYLPQFNFLPKNRSIGVICSDYGADLKEFSDRFELQIEPSARAGDVHGAIVRMLEIYLLLNKGTKFTFLDEPFTHLSPLLVEKLCEYLQEVKLSKGIILTDHQFHTIKNIAEELYILRDGSLKYIKDISEVNSYVTLLTEV